MRRERSYCHWYGGSGGCYISVARVCGTSSVPIKTTRTTHKSLSSKHAKAKNEKNMCVCNVHKNKWRKTKRNTAIKTLPPIIHPLKMAGQYTQGIQGSKEEGIAEIVRYSCIKLKTKHHSYQFSKRTTSIRYYFARFGRQKSCQIRTRTLAKKGCHVCGKKKTKYSNSHLLEALSH